jgi:hypothetical protein
MNLASTGTTTWPSVVFTLGAIALGVFLIIAVMASLQEVRKSKLKGLHEDRLRQLVSRYEQLAETTLDAQQRIAADVSELRSRTMSIEQILRTVE